MELFFFGKEVERHNFTAPWESYYYHDDSRGYTPPVTPPTLAEEYKDSWMNQDTSEMDILNPEASNDQDSGYLNTSRDFQFIPPAPTVRGSWGELPVRSESQGSNMNSGRSESTGSNLSAEGFTHLPSN